MDRARGRRAPAGRPVAPTTPPNLAPPMQTRQYRLAQHADAWDAVPPGDIPDAQLVFAFGPAPGGAGGVPGAAWFAAMTERWPDAARVYCSTAGHVAGTDLVDGDVVVTVVRFAHTRVRAAAVATVPGDHGPATGARLAAALPTEGLRHVLVFARGLQIDGGALLEHMTAALPAEVRVSGGLAGDDDRFGTTVVALDGAPDGLVDHAAAVAVGLYGDRIAVGAGALGGWEIFGPARFVTRAAQTSWGGGVVYELDGEPALALYRRYLGPLAAELPVSGLLFPLALTTRSGAAGAVRTVLGVDEASGALHFGGPVPEGTYVRMMKASADRLIDAAAEVTDLAQGGAALALVVSCAGRRWLLRQRTEEELEAVRDALGPDVCLAGFYSYGEFAPAAAAGCEMHNQTLTVTTFYER